jgi:AcrR family transcriptional regulator
MGIEERRKREKIERRDLILRSAIQVYVAEGYHGTTMEKIAAKAELSRATLYLYFKTKDEIFVHAIVSLSDYFAELLEDVYKRRKTLGKNIMKDLWESFQKFYDKDPVTVNVTLYFHQSEMIRNLPQDLRLLLDRTGSRNYELLCKIIKHGINQGFFGKCNPKTLAEVVWTTFLGIIHLENSKKAMSRKTHLDVTWDLAYEILSKGIMSKGVIGP